jgi:uncharacterized OsmC-like protein
MRNRPILPALLLLLAVCGCSSMYYGTMEKMGIHKRDILVDRVAEARDSQEQAKKQFQSALEQFKSVVKIEGGDLEREYDRLSDTLKGSEEKARLVRERIRAVEDVSNALFREWRTEIGQYTSDSLRRSSQTKYDATQDKYRDLIGAMKKAESRLEPALAPLRDQVLFMKHNLNAKAIAGLRSEVEDIQVNVDQLVREMETAIDEADRFIDSLQKQE